ncbi:hypothetical protein BDC45DRAFT_538469 [Circinella umbellata]|nr:hypothetical protein BDC45DRAFT_538469 [Circinella umbellata]
MCKRIANTIPIDDFLGDDEYIQESLCQSSKMYSLESSDKSGKMESSFTLDTIYPICTPFLQKSMFITRKEHQYILYSAFCTLHFLKQDPPCLASLGSFNGRRPKIFPVESQKPLRAWLQKVCDVEVTKVFIEYRAQSIQKAKAGQLMSIHEELSDLEYGFKSGSWEMMVKECRDRYPIDGLPADTEEAVISFTKVDKIIKTFPDGDDNSLIKESLRNLVSQYAPNTSNKVVKRVSSFTMKVVVPIILPFLKKNAMLSRRGTDGKVHGAASQRRIFNSLNCQFFEYGEDLPEEGLYVHCFRDGSRISSNIPNEPIAVFYLRRSKHDFAGSSANTEIFFKVHSPGFSRRHFLQKSRGTRDFQIGGSEKNGGLLLLHIVRIKECKRSVLAANFYVIFLIKFSLIELGK